MYTTVIIKKAYIRLIINSETIAIAEKLVDEIISKVSVDENSLAELKMYEDDFHYEFTFSINLTVENYSDLEFKAFKLCTTISMGPWLYVNLPEDENEFEFEAIFNHEAFIHHSPEYNNKLKWAHLEVN